MNRPNSRNSTSRWRALGTATLTLAAVAVIGFTSIAPARADGDDWRYRGGWHGRDWREHRERPSGFSFSYSYPSYSYTYVYPSYGYYSYPSYGYYGGSDYGYDDSR